MQKKKSKCNKNAAEIVSKSMQNVARIDTKNIYFRHKRWSRNHQNVVYMSRIWRKGKLLARSWASKKRQNDAKMEGKCVQNDAKMVPKWCQNAAKIASKWYQKHDFCINWSTIWLKLVTCIRDFDGFWNTIFHCFSRYFVCKMQPK